MLESVFDEWVREAEQRLLVSVDYPLIDSSEIDMADELRTLANRVVEEHFGEASRSTPSEIEPVVAFLELRLIRSQGTLPVRFVVLNFLYRLAQFKGFLSEESPALLRDEVWPHFETFVRLQEVTALQEPQAIRWEITNACAIHDWDQASTLFDRLKSLGAITALQCRALKGQMYVCSVVVPRDEDESQKHLAWWWLPQLDSTYFTGRGDSFGPSVRQFELMGWGMTLAGQVEYSAEEYARLSDAAHEWETAFQKDSDLLGSYRAAWGKCYFISKNYVKAAEQFEHLLVRGLGLTGLLNEAEAGFRSTLYQNAAECYEKGGVVEAAIRLLERCTQEFPKTKGLWLKLAGVYISSPLAFDLHKVQDCLRREEEIDPSFGEDPRASIALMLGELAGNDLPASLRKVAESRPEDLQFMTSVVSRHWPSYQSLDEKSRKEWVGAALLLWGASTPSWQRAHLGRRVAGYFAEIVEGHLKRLFDRFRQEKGNMVLQKMPPGPKKDKFQKFLEGSNLSLGEMISEIDGTRRLPEPQYPDLKAWLQRNARRLSQNWDSKRAWRLNELRRWFSHPGSELSDNDAIELYDLSVWFVNQLYGD